MWLTSVASTSVYKSCQSFRVSTILIHPTCSLLLAIDVYAASHSCKATIDQLKWISIIVMERARVSKCLLSATDVVSITDTQNTATLLQDGICVIHCKSQLKPLMFALCSVDLWNGKSPWRKYVVMIRCFSCLTVTDYFSIYAFQSLLVILLFDSFFCFKMSFLGVS